MRRGDLVTVALQGDMAKPRPARIVQSDLFEAHPSVTVLPITSTRQDAPLFRIAMQADPVTGLHALSDVMLDKPQSVPRDRLGPVFGHADDETMLAVNRALAVFLGLA